MNNTEAEDIVAIHLPNGKVYEVKTQKKTLDEDDITKFRNFMNDSACVNITVKSDRSNSLLKEKVLLLWGDVLKNSYITIDRY